MMELLGGLKTENIPQLVIYFVFYQLGTYVWRYLVTIPSYIQCYLIPLFVQKFYHRSYYGDSGMEKLHNYLYHISPKSFNYIYSKNKSRFNKFDGNTSISPGNYVIKYKNKMVYVHVSSDTSNAGHLYLTTTMKALSFDKEFFNNFMKESNEHFLKKRLVYTGKIDRDRELYWRIVGRVSQISFKDAIISSENQKNFESAFSRFKNPTQREIDLKIPQRFVVLISGPPGFGKTTMVKAVAHEYNMHIVSTSVTLLDDSSLINIGENLEDESCLVLEDIDAMTSTHDRGIATGDEDETKSKPKHTVSLSAFLNFLDGVSTPEGLVVIMTTNHPEKLDPALIRSERVHLHLKFGPDLEVYSRFIQRFYPDASVVEITSFAEYCMSRAISTATLQSVFRRFEDIAEALTFMKFSESEENKKD